MVEKLVSADTLIQWIKKAENKPATTTEAMLMQLVVLPGFRNKVNELPDMAKPLLDRIEALEQNLKRHAAKPAPRSVTAHGEDIKSAANEILESIRYNVFTARNEEWHFNATKSVSCTQVWLCHGTDNDTKILVELDDAQCPILEGRVYDGLVERFGDDPRFEVTSAW